MVTPTRTRKSGTGNPPPTAGAPALDPTEEVLQRFPQPQAAAQPPSQGLGPGPGWCHTHGVAMTLNNKESKTWYSHKTPEGWCKGKGR